MRKISNCLIIKAIGGLYFVQSPDGVYECKARGIFRNRNISPCCGDRVEIEVMEDNIGLIVKIGERKNSLIRPPLANLDMLVFVTSTCEPRPNLTILDKFIAISEYKNIEPLIVFTKIDKSSSDKYVEIYKKAGIDCISCDNISQDGCFAVRNKIAGKLVAFTGNTGVGKSSLVNNIFGNSDIKTNEISKKLGRGKHTTRHVELYQLDNKTFIADTPGFSTFETMMYDVIFKQDLADCFVEFHEYFGKCKFSDCSHTKEKGCAVIDAVNEGKIPKSRHESYCTMYEEAKAIKEWEVR